MGRGTGTSFEKARASAELVRQEEDRPVATGHDQDYVLVDDDEENKAPLPEDLEALKGKAVPSSPAGVQLTLETPKEGELTRNSSAVVPLTLDAEAMSAWRDHQALSKTSSVVSLSDLAGVSEPPANERDRALKAALDEATSQHQWAMEAVIRGWEAEKAELLLKLEKMTESRDALEAELKHSENNFAGLVEGVLEQKLDQMIVLLQEGRAGLGQSAPLNSMGDQPAPVKAQQVVTELAVLLDTMKQQQAAIEERVSDIQSSVLQLTPRDDGEDSTAPLSRRSQPDLPSPERAQRRSGGKNVFGKALSSIGCFFNQAKVMVCEKAPVVSRGAADFAGRAVTAPVRFTGAQAGRFNRFLRVHGVRDEHLHCVAGLAVGIVATSVLVKAAGKRTAAPALELEADEEWVHEIEIMGGDEPAGDDTVEIILNRNGVYKKAGRDDPMLVVAWPI